MKATLRLFVLLLLIVLVAACGGDDDDDEGNEIVSSDSTPTASPATNGEESDDGTAPTLSSGTIVYSQDEALYTLVDGEPVLVADGILPEESLWPSRSRQHLMFGTPDQLGNYPIFYFDPAEGSAEQVHVVSEGFFRDANWAPDEEWLMLIFVQSGPVFIRNDGGAVVIVNDLIEERFSVNEFVWLSDGSVLVADGSYNPAASSTDYERIAHIEPAVPQVTLLENPEDYGALFDVATDLGLEARFGSGTSYYARGGEAPEGGFVPPSSLGACDTWRIMHQGEPIYTAQNIYHLSEIVATDDDEVFFVQWVYPDCRLSLSDPPEPTLMHVDANGEAVALLEDALSPEFGGSRDFNPYVAPTTRYAVSPDGEQLLWIGGTIAEGQTTLNVMDLTSGESTMLVETSINAATGGGVIRGVYWLAAE